MVARYLGVVEAAGSNPVTQTKKRESKDSRFLFCFTALPQNIHIKQAKTAPKALTPSMLFFSALLRSFLMGCYAICYAVCVTPLFLLVLPLTLAKIFTIYQRLNQNYLFLCASSPSCGNFERNATVTGKVIAAVITYAAGCANSRPISPFPLIFSQSTGSR